MIFNKETLNSLFRYALSLTGKEEHAYDLVFDGVEKVLVRPFVLNKKAYAKKYIRNKFINDGKKMTESYLANEYSDLNDLDQTVINKDEVEQLLNKLSFNERELLYLWAVENYGLREISNITSEPRGILTSRLSRLKQRLERDNEG